MGGSYLNISHKEFKKRIDKLFKILKHCTLCPRKCKVNRLKNERGFCDLGWKPKVFSFHPHFGEEKVLVGERGSGTIFFTSCNLTCVFCQNFEISQLKEGEEICCEKLSQIMLTLQDFGCANINLVTPTCQIPQIVKSLFLAREKGLKIPVVYNTNSYERVEVLRLLEGIVDIYLPDFKYSNNEIALKYSGVSNYFEVAKKAIKEMHRQVGDLVLDEKGIAQKGVLVRHLVLPNDLAGTEEIFRFLSTKVSKNIFLNIMDQYYPCFKAFEYDELNRPITKKEYEKALNLAQKYGLRRISR